MHRGRFGALADDSSVNAVMAGLSSPRSDLLGTPARPRADWHLVSYATGRLPIGTDSSSRRISCSGEKSSRRNALAHFSVWTRAMPRSWSRPFHTLTGWYATSVFVPHQRTCAPRHPSLLGAWSRYTCRLRSSSSRPLQYGRRIPATRIRDPRLAAEVRRGIEAARAILEGTQGCRHTERAARNSRVR